MNWEHPGTGLVLLNLISKLPGWMGIKPCNPPSHCNPPIDIILLLPVSPDSIGHKPTGKMVWPEGFKSNQMSHRTSAMPAKPTHWPALVRSSCLPA
eukprot:scaffold235379_cov18-Tisochrysis_lutea.AAC.1